MPQFRIDQASPRVFKYKSFAAFMRRGLVAVAATATVASLAVYYYHHRRTASTNGERDEESPKTKRTPESKVTTVAVHLSQKVSAEEQPTTELIATTNCDNTECKEVDENVGTTTFHQVYTVATRTATNINRSSNVRILQAAENQDDPSLKKMHVVASALSTTACNNKEPVHDIATNKSHNETFTKSDSMVEWLAAVDSPVCLVYADDDDDDVATTDASSAEESRKDRSTKNRLRFFARVKKGKIRSLVVVRRKKLFKNVKKCFKQAWRLPWKKPSTEQDFSEVFA